MIDQLILYEHEGAPSVMAYTLDDGRLQVVGFFGDGDGREIYETALARAKTWVRFSGSRLRKAGGGTYSPAGMLYLVGDDGPAERKRGRVERFAEILREKHAAAGA